VERAQAPSTFFYPNALIPSEQLPRREKRVEVVEVVEVVLQSPPVLRLRELTGASCVIRGCWMA
jgi:hypothetical protein